METQDELIMKTLNNLLADNITRSKQLGLDDEGYVLGLTVLYNIPLHTFLKKQSLNEIKSLIEDNSKTQSFLLGLVSNTYSRFRVLDLDLRSITMDTCSFYSSLQTPAVSDTLSDIMYMEEEHIRDLLSDPILSVLYLYRLYMSSLPVMKTLLTPKST